jgi:putative DNA primase/helicase
MLSSDDKYSQGLEFLKALFGSGSEQPIFLQTLANDGDDPDEKANKRWLMSRDVDAILRFIAKHDRARRGMFACVSTMAEGASTRSKDNSREIVCLHQDLDFKGIVEDEPAIWAAIAQLEAQPSMIVRSGGGLHLYWLLREPLDAQTHRDEVDTLLKALAEIVAGDPATCEIARLMRLPGSGNSKYGDVRTVVIERLNPELRYELDGLSEWIGYQRAVLTRKPPTEKPATNFRRSEPAPDNPFLAAAAAMGRQPRLDVEEALRAMGQGNIHDTQVRVSASLLARGEPVEDVVSILMEATRQAAGQPGNSWNWRAEEDRIRLACAGAIKKFPPALRPAPEPEPDPKPEPDSGPADNVADLGAARAKRKPAPPHPKRGKINHIDIGEIFLAGLEASGQALMFTKSGAYRYEAGLWRMEDDRTLKAWLDASIEQCIRGTEVKSRISLVNETRAWIIRHPDLQQADTAFDRHGLVPTLSGLVDPRTGEVLAANQHHYCTWRVPFNFDPAAGCPFWLEMLGDAFADRSPEVRSITIDLIQEVLGAGMIDNRSKALAKAFIAQGGSNYGKSGVLDVMGGLFGPDSNATPLDMIDSNAHAMMPFLRRVPWVLHEAFDQSKWHMSSAVKAIISGDIVQINVKGGRIFEHRSQAPAFWGTNGPPQFREATEAITNRIIVVEFRRKFLEDHPVGAALEAHRRGYSRPSDMVLAIEMEGVLAWAMVGLRRALARGHFILPEESRDAAANIRLDSNLVAGFIEDCVDFDPDMRVASADFCASFAVWWTENKGENRNPPSNDSIGKAIIAYGDNRIASHRKELKGAKGRRYYAGIKLNEVGLRFWDTAIDSNNFTGKTASTAAKGAEVNSTIPSAWYVKPCVEAMQVAHAKFTRGQQGGRENDDGSAKGHSKPMPPNPPPQVSPNEAVDSLDESPL